MVRRNRKVYRELEAKAQLLEQLTPLASAAIDEIEALRSENRVLRLALSNTRVRLERTLKGLDRGLESE